MLLFLYRVIYSGLVSIYRDSYRFEKPSSQYQIETPTKWGEGQPQCEEDFNSCTYISTSGSVNNWATHYCSYPEMFGCEVEERDNKARDNLAFLS